MLQAIAGVQIKRLERRIVNRLRTMSIMPGCARMDSSTSCCTHPCTRCNHATPSNRHCKGNRSRTNLGRGTKSSTSTSRPTNVLTVLLISLPLLVILLKCQAGAFSVVRIDTMRATAPMGSKRLTGGNVNVNININVNHNQHSDGSLVLSAREKVRTTTSPSTSTSTSRTSLSMKMGNRDSNLDGKDEQVPITNQNKTNKQNNKLIMVDENKAMSQVRTSTRKGTRTANILASFLATSVVAIPISISTSPATTTTTSSFLPPRVSFNPLRAWALTEQQLLVNNVWTEVTRQYVDQSFNGLGEEGWRKKRLEAVTKVSNVGPDETEIVYSTIRTMLSYLGDPYTKFLTPEQFETMTSYARGSPAKAGIGVQLVADPATGKIVVFDTVPGGPAAQVGVLPGDIIRQVNGVDISDGATAEVVAAQCRGEPDTEVALAVQHGGDGKPEETVTNLLIKRSQIKAESVESATFLSEKGDKVGLIKLSSFNLGTEKKVVEALNNIVNARVTAIVLDLRGNVGGYMPAGVDCAKLFLQPNARVISEVDKAGRATIYINDGVGSETKLPLYVLVDKRTASASEILTAALQDNHRATVVGTKTFGKGRIQNLQELLDGSGVTVTKAKYITPQGKDIHGVGITPDIQTNACSASVKPEACVASFL